MNSYNFPDHVEISEAAKDLIKKILQKDPKKRPGLDDIMNHDFMNPGYTIPKVLPSSLLVCPPSSSFLNQFNIMSSTARGTVGFGIEKQEGFEHYLNKFKNRQDGALTAKTKSPENLAKITARTQNVSPHEIINTAKTAPVSKPPEVWVKKWVDYSTKYGLGYMLSNNAFGVFFNDSTKIIVEPKGVHFDYIERKIADKQEIIHTHTLTDYPEEFHKKVTLMQHFKNYLETESKDNTIESGEKGTENEENNTNDRKIADIVYV